MIAKLYTLQRQRRGWQRARVRIELQAKAEIRSLCKLEGTKEQRKREAQRIFNGLGTGAHPEEETIILYTMPLLDARAALQARENAVEKEMRALAKTLPVYPWIESVRGVTALTLAQIVGECGDLGWYASPAKVWKRMGCAVIHGERQRRVAGDPLLAIEHGYVAHRRATVFVIGDGIVKAGEGHYRSVYDERKAYEIARAEEQGLKVALAAKIPKGKESEYRSAGHIHLRAKRYMEKRFLRDLWRAWRETKAPLSPKGDLSPAPADREEP